MQVTVVGAGIIGLTTARVLAERGHDVRVVAAETEGTTSTVAAAVWFPYRCGPRDKVLAWANTTREWLASLPHDAGVDLLTAYEISDDDPNAGKPWWSTEVTREPAPVIGAPLAWKYEAPRVEPAIFLPWLTRFPIERRRVLDLDAEPGDIVVNCTGLAARELCGDDALTGLFGQVVITEPGDVDRTITITDDRADLFYVIPRRNELVLGGCSLVREVIDPAITDRILSQARAFGLRHGPVKAVRAAQRPFRETVRLERIGRVIHNYGHGGAGFTLCYGCALEVAYLM